MKALALCRRFYGRLTGAKPLWLTASGFFFIWLVIKFLPIRSQDELRIAGGFLQLLGVLVVAIGLERTRKQFQERYTHEQIIDWFRSFRKAFSEPHGNKQYRQNNHSTSISADNVSYPRINSEASDEDRLANLEIRSKAFEKEIRTIQVDVSDKVSKSRLDEIIFEERLKQNQKYNKLQQKLENLAVGGLNLEAVGLVWLVVGIALSSFSNEIAYLIMLLR